jgi:hypothetical protein
LPELMERVGAASHLAHSRLPQLPHDEVAQAVQVGASIPCNGTNHAPENPREAPEDNGLRQVVLGGVFSHQQRDRLDQPLRVQRIVGETLRGRGLRRWLRHGRQDTRVPSYCQRSYCLYISALTCAEAFATREAEHACRAYAHRSKMPPRRTPA